MIGIKSRVNFTEERIQIFNSWKVIIIRKLDNRRQNNFYIQIFKCGNANVFQLTPHLEIKHFEEYKFAFVDNDMKYLLKYGIKYVNEFIRLRKLAKKLVKLDFVTQYIRCGSNYPQINTVINDCLVNGSIFTDNESTNY